MRERARRWNGRGRRPACGPMVRPSCMHCVPYVLLYRALVAAALPCMERLLEHALRVLCLRLAFLCGVGVYVVGGGVGGVGAHIHGFSLSKVYYMHVVEPARAQDLREPLRRTFA